jgi:serine/threonine-protein kinase
LALGGWLCASLAAAEEWHEAYRAGLSALAHADHAAAAERFQRAIALRPEPGRNVVTYGTNVEPRYYPYLRLAEALLALGRLEDARRALETSAARGREPAEERERLLARLEPPPATSVARASPSPTISAAPTEPSAAPTAPPTAPPTASPTVAVLAPPAATPSAAGRATRAPATPSASPRLEAATGRIEIIATPAGALAYIDDEPLGSTDPQTGRLLKNDLAPGRHRVRLACTGHKDVVGAVDVSAGGVATFRAALPAVALAPDTPVSRAAAVAFAAVAAALIAVTAWMVLRRPPLPVPLRVNTPHPGESSGTQTPPDLANPGVHRDVAGQEWFGEYRLLGPLGRGGMASVYRAERRAEIVALKRPLSNLLVDPELTERFSREAEIGRSLNHPNIVRIVDRGTVDGVPYFAMELVPGETLQAFIRSWGAAVPRTAASIVAQVAEALDYAHSKKVVHRDVKPSNIMLLLDGTAKVMDFGIARSQRFDGLTMTGAFLGTPSYSAPETIQGSGGDARSDLYSLGVVFYELLTGRKPYVADTPYSLLQKQVTEDAEPPSRFCTVHPELETLVLRLLRRTPAERPESAEALVVALRDWLNVGQA